MENYLIGKCYRVHDEGVDSLMYIGSSLYFGWYYIGQRLVKSSTKGVGYFTDTDILNFERANLVEIDPTIWDKIHKILKMNAVACNSILELAKKPDKFTRYTKCMFPTDCYKLFQPMGNSDVMVKFSPKCAYISIEDHISLLYEKCSLITEEQISPETYTKVRNTVVNVINQINDIWTSI